MLSLDKAKFDEGLGILIKACSSDLKNDIDALGAAACAVADSEPAQQVVANGARFEEIWNGKGDDAGFKKTLQGVINDFKAMFDITEMIEKTQLEEVKMQNLEGVSTGQVDASGVNF